MSEESNIRELPESYIARSQIRAVVRAEITKFADDILAKAIGEAIGNIVREVEAGFQDALREFSYKGNWSEGVLYRKGNFVSMGGQVYHCDHDCKDARPGIDLVNWSLAVKSGRDGRDGRNYATPIESEKRFHPGGW